jgi:hypothetical protein
MFAGWPTVSRGVQLQEHLVSTAGQVKGEDSEVAGFNALAETLWKSEVEEIGRSRVDPTVAEAQGLADVLRRLQELSGKRLRLHVVSSFDQRDDVEITGRTLDHAQQHQATAAYSDQFI